MKETHLRREIDVTGGINQVDQESVTVGFLLDPLHIFLSKFIVKLNRYI